MNMLNRGSSADQRSVDTAMDTASTKMREHMHGVRYGEILLVTGHLTHIEAAVYNTLGFNDCPDDLWNALDVETIKKENKARAVILNGPRYFLMDKTTIANVGDDIRTFGALQMRRLATVRIPLTSLLDGMKQKPYTERIVERTTTYIYNSGREIYELIAPDGTTYIMQTYALIVDPNLTEEDLKTLGSRLHLPRGWQYRVRQLEQECALHAHGEAHLIQDELQNSYQRADK